MMDDAMKNNEAAEAEDRPVVLQDFRPQVEFFFQEMTAEQWRLLTSGAPDDATKIMLADLMLHIITSLSSTFMTALKVNAVLSEEHVRSSLGDTFTQMFADVLDVKEDQSGTSGLLMDLVCEEVADTVNSSISSDSSPSEVPCYEHITPPSRVNSIVSHACRMLRALMTKGGKMCFRKNKQHVTMEDQEALPFVAAGPSSAGVSRDQISPEDSLWRGRAEVVQNTVTKEVIDIMEPLLQAVPEPQVALLLSRTSEEIKSLMEDISPALTEKSTTSHHKKKSRPCLRTARAKIKNLFTRCFTKVLIHRQMAALKTKFCQASECGSRQWQMSFTDAVDELLDSLDGEEHEGEHVNPRFQNISRGKDLVFIEALTEVFQTHTSQEMMVEIASEQFGNNTVAFMEPVPEISGDIQTKLRCFMVLMYWWLNTKVDSHCENVTLTFTFTESQSPKENGSGPAHKFEERRTEEEETKRKRAFVSTLLDLLLWQVLDGTKTRRNMNAVSQRLSELTWARLEGVDSSLFDPDRLRHLWKGILKDLYKELGRGDTMLLTLFLNERAVEDLIVSTIMRHLKTPAKKRSAPCRASSFLGDCFWFFPVPTRK